MKLSKLSDWKKAVLMIVSALALFLLIYWVSPSFWMVPVGAVAVGAFSMLMLAVMGKDQDTKTILFFSAIGLIVSLLFFFAE